MILFQVDSDRLRAEAERILSHPKYRVDTTGGERLQRLLMEAWFRFLRFLEAIADLVGGPVVLSVIILGLVVAVALLLGANLGRRRARETEERIRREHALALGLDPARLEGQAEEAAGLGDYAGAVRLLFRAGLLRLDERGRIDFRPGLTTGEIEEQLRSPLFRRLSNRFEEVAYGGRTASAQDYQEASVAWRELLGESVGAGR